jgi:hypothetical protein
METQLSEAQVVTVSFGVLIWDVRP